MRYKTWYYPQEDSLEAIKDIISMKLYKRTNWYYNLMLFWVLSSIELCLTHILREASKIKQINSKDLEKEIRWSSFGKYSKLFNVIYQKDLQGIVWLKIYKKVKRAFNIRNNIIHWNYNEYEIVQSWWINESIIEDKKDLFIWMNEKLDLKLLKKIIADLIEFLEKLSNFIEEDDEKLFEKYRKTINTSMNIGKIWFLEKQLEDIKELIIK